MQEETQYQLFTNSCIQLSIPFEYQQYGTICCNWSTVPYRMFQSYLAQYVTSQHLRIKDKQRTFYLCSPLDIGSFIMVKIQNQSLTQNKTFQQLKYGPVQLEPTLLSAVQSNNWRHVELLLSKNNKKQATIKVQPQSKQASRQKLSFSIQIKIGQNKINFYINEELAKANIQSFHKNSFFKIYDSQPNTVGIYIAHQMSQFEDKLKQLKISYHLGQYLKIFFENRLCRDIFIINCISMTDINVDTVKEFNIKLRQIQNFYNKGNSTVKILSSLKNIHKQLFKIPKIQTTIRASQIMNNQFLAVSEIGSPKIQQNILQDIYNILQTPINKIQRESFNGPEQKSYTNNPTTQQKNIYINNNASCSKSAKNNGQLNYGKQDLYQRNSKKFFNLQKRPSINKLQSLDFHKKQFYYPNGQHNGDTTFKHELSQINLLQKINELMKINQQLVLENRRLRFQNQKLKSESSKNQKVKQLNKMLEIKEMVQIVAQKLQSLEQQDEANQIISSTPRHFQSKKTLKYQNRKRVVQNSQKQIFKQNQNNKRFWSPRTHLQLVKNFKQKNTEQKQTARKTQPDQFNRQKSLSNFSMNQNNTSKSKLKQQSKIPQFLYNNSEGVQRLKNQRTQVQQTLQINQRIKKNKQFLMASTKQLYINSQTQKTSNTKNQNLTPNPLLASFRNVFGQ